jgi:hypothetical protein
MHPDKRLRSHEGSLLRLKPKKTALRTIFGPRGGLTFTRL